MKEENADKEETYSKSRDTIQRGCAYMAGQEDHIEGNVDFSSPKNVSTCLRKANSAPGKGVGMCRPSLEERCCLNQYCWSRPVVGTALDEQNTLQCIRQKRGRSDTNKNVLDSNVGTIEDKEELPEEQMTLVILFKMIKYWKTCFQPQQESTTNSRDRTE